MKRPLRKLAIITGVGIAGGLGVGLAQRRLRPVATDDPVAPSWPPLTPPSTATPASAASPITTLHSNIEVPEPPQGQRWVEPDEHGSCRASHPIKANADSGIYHRPDGAFYERTKAERCYADAADAESDGFRAARR